MSRPREQRLSRDPARFGHRAGSRLSGFGWDCWDSAAAAEHPPPVLLPVADRCRSGTQHAVLVAGVPFLGRDPLEVESAAEAHEIPLGEIAAEVEPLVDC